MAVMPRPCLFRPLLRRFEGIVERLLFWQRGPSPRLLEKPLLREELLRGAGDGHTTPTLFFLTVHVES